jgi:RNA polymerase sigma-70 factor (family 1)
LRSNPLRLRGKFSLFFSYFYPLIAAMPTITLLQEKELLLQVAQGSESAFAQIFNHYRKKIYSTGIVITHSPEIAEELVQDVFLKIWLKRNDLPAIQNFEAHLFIITRNVAYDILRRLATQRRVYQQVHKESPTFGNITDDALIEKANKKVLQEAIQRLPPQQKQVYLFMREEGMKRQEVADLMGIQPNTVKEHMAKALRSIRAYCVANLDLYIQALCIILPLMDRK